jgi:hypothetical protein
MVQKDRYFEHAPLFRHAARNILVKIGKLLN